MAFDFGGLLGGGLSGAVSGSAFGPIGTIAGGLLGGLGSAFGGGGETPTYEPTQLQQSLTDYANQQVTANKGTKKYIRAKAKSLAAGGGPGAAEAFLEQYVDKFSNPKFVTKQLKKSYKRPVDYGSSSPFWDTADQLYKGQGVGFTGEEYGGFVDAAKARGIRSPQAFADMIKQDMITKGMVATPQQEMLGAMFGGIRRDPTGRISNMYSALNQNVSPASLSRSTTTITI